MAEFDNRYASNGKGNAGVALGTVGTVLGGLATLGNGLLGNWNNGGCNRNGCGWNGYGDCSENMPVTRYEMSLQQQLAEKDSAIALRDANTYGDQKLLEVYKYFDGKLKEVNDALCAQAVFNQKTSDGLEIVRKDIAMEAERRCCADNSIVTYANATFYEKLITGITPATTAPTPQKTYNPIPNCNSCCNGNN